MNATDFHETMLRLLRHESFQTFLIELADGRSFRVDDPESVSTSGAGAILGTSKGDIILFDCSDTRRMVAAAHAPA